MTLAKARVINYDHNSSFIVLATVIMTVNYNGKTFMVQATGVSKKANFSVFVKYFFSLVILQKSLGKVLRGFLALISYYFFSLPSIFYWIQTLTLRITS
jgi:hypothetical protein